MAKLPCLILLIVLSSCAVFSPNELEPQREFRGVWVATVANIDWPKNGKDLVAKQQKDYLKILDFYAALNFNAIIVQLRTAGDAFYPSAWAPWSRFLTGTEGIALDTHHTLLPWMIEEAHDRGFEFHAWLNPYRATFDENLDILSESHDYFVHPDWMIKYGTKYYYNPGEPEVQHHLVKIIDELVSNYAVDAIHFDDYFYPYKISGEVFRDSSAYQLHHKPTQTLAEWRRSNIDSLIKRTHETIKNRKPWVQFGVSPFGVWKNNSTDRKGSDTRAGQTTYEDLYADPLLWMKQGWIDYLVPQVYWSLHYAPASHYKILNWWATQPNTSKLYIGNGAYKIRDNADKAWNKRRELLNQLQLARNTNQVNGNVFFSARSLMGKNEDVAKKIKRKYYKNRVLPPATQLTDTKTKIPIALTDFNDLGHELQFTFSFLNDTNMQYAMLYTDRKKERLSSLKNKKAIAKIHIANTDSFRIPKSKFRYRKPVAFTFVDQYGSETEPIVLNLVYDSKK